MRVGAKKTPTGRREEPAKGKAKASRPLAPRAPTKGAARVHDLEKRLAKSLEREAATAEISRVISQSPTDVQPVFDAIITSAVRLLGAYAGSLTRIAGDQIELAALASTDAAGDAAVRAAFPQSLHSERTHAQAIRDRAPLNIADAYTDPRVPEAEHTDARVRGYRSLVAVRLLRRDEAIGSISVTRRAPGGFTDDEIALLQTFADQAVIAIENARLLSELQTSNRDLTSALDTQTATSDILRVISRSQTDVQPVFDAIVVSAVRLLGAYSGALTRVAGDQLELAAHTSTDDASDAALKATYPQSLESEFPHAQAIRDRAPFNIADHQTDPRWPESERARAGLRGYRSRVVVPLLRQDEAIGAIAVTRREPGGFTDAEIALLQTFADQAVIAIENARLLGELQASNRDLTSALDTQTATSDILSVISRSQTDVQPVFDAIVQSAVRLLGAYSGVLTRIAGDQIEIAALTSTDAAGNAAVRAAFPQSLHSEFTQAQAIRGRAPLNISDAQTDPRLPEGQHATARVRGYRSQVAVPMLRRDEVVGSIGVNRREPGGFTDDEIALLQTFADQAVIAIENARLLTELQQKNGALTEALGQQTATGEILSVISSSPTDVQPVFDTIVASCRRLLGARTASVLRIVEGELRLAAFTATSVEADEELRRFYPRPLDRSSIVGRATRERVPVVVSDTETDEGLAPPSREVARRRGYRSMVAVPMLLRGVSIGTLTVSRAEPGAFAEKDVALLQTFADQAVIAIENVRLFTELQTSNRDLTSALDTQTATSDILRVISRSQTDVQPVFEAILASAVRLLGGYAGALTRISGDQIELAALTSTDGAGDAAARASFPQSLQAQGPHAQVIRDRAPINIADIETGPLLPEAWRAMARARGFRSWGLVPLLRHDEAIGTIAVTRLEPGGFTDDEIALLQTFADQAVIAIENARLLTELQARTAELTQSVDQLTALGEVGQAVSSSLDVDTVLNTIVARAVELAGADGGTLYEYDERAEAFELRVATNLDDQVRRLQRTSHLRLGEGAVGVAGATREPVQVPDIAIDGAYDSRLRPALLRAGTRALLAVPLVREERIVGGLVVSRRTPGAFAPEVVSVLKTFATQSALAIQNARLFREIEVKSRELEVASQHKSEFLANMSHELRTPLNAIIGFSDVLLERMFGEINAKQTEYLRDILGSGQHLLSLINDILDLSKIEAGRMELDAAAFDLPTAIDDALLLMRERAGRRGITLERHVAEGVGELRADQRKVKQVLLNLLSNAVKFTPEGGRIDVRAGLANGTAEISVTDTGIGIAAEDHDAVFEEFRQVGAVDKKAEGTGLGLALCRRFVELHGGRIWVKSQPGAGSTFTFSLPLSR